MNASAHYSTQRADGALPPIPMTGANLYSRLLRYVRPYRWAFGVAVFGMMIVAAGDLLLAWLVIPIVRNFESPDPTSTRWLPLAIVGVFLLRGVGAYISEYGMGWTGYRVVFDLRRDLIDKLLKLPTPYYDTYAAGVIQSKVSFDAHQLASAASGAITNAIRSSLTIVVSFGYLMWLNWRLTLLTFVVVPIVGVVIRYFSRRLRRIARDIQDRSGSLTQVLEELIGGHRVVRIFGGEEYERNRAVGAANRLRNAMTKESSATAASSPLTVFFAACAVGSIVYIALGQSEAGRFDFALFMSYVVALLTLLERLKGLSGINAAIQRGLAAAESIFGLLDHEEEADTGTVVLSECRGEVRFERLSLRYASNERDALSDITLTVAPGETVALVGASGSGKTSLVNLVPRFYEPTAGRLFIDGHDVTTLTLSSLRAQIAMVSQDVLLFNDTVAANIAYGANGQRVARGSGAGRRGCPCAGLHPRDAGRIRFDGRRARRPPLRWPAATHCDRARHPQERATADPRRGHLGARFGIRAPGPGRAGYADARAHDDRDRAPAVDDRGCRSHRGARRGPHCRDRHARGVAGRQLHVRPAAPHAVHAGRAAGARGCCACAVALDSRQRSAERSA